MTRVINVLGISIPNWSPYSATMQETAFGFITFFYAGYFVLCTASLLFSCGPVMMMIPESFFPCFVVAFSLSLFHLISPHFTHTTTTTPYLILSHFYLSHYFSYIYINVNSPQIMIFAQ